MLPSKSGGLISTDRLDLSKPVLCESFPDSSNRTSPGGSQRGARIVLLELGITLLELWELCIIEEYAQNVNTAAWSDCYSRLSLAHRWLDDAEDRVLPLYHDVAARCIHCHFENASVNPKWADLQDGLVKAVIEPL